MNETENFNSMSWNGWKDIPTGHNQAVTAISTLREHIDSMRTNLEMAHDQFKTAKDSSQQTYDTEVQYAHIVCKTDQERFTKECESNVEATQNRKNATSVIIGACNSFVNNLPKESSQKVISAAREAIQTVNSREGRVFGAISNKVRAYQVLRDCQIAEAETTRNEKIDKARRDQINRDTYAEHEFAEKRRIICEKGQLDIRNGFNKTALREYQQKIKSSEFNVENYECPTDIPEYIMLGNIGLIVPNQTQEDMAVVQVLDCQTADVAVRVNGNYVIEIPYAQRLSDGISLLMRYSPSDRAYVQSLIQPLLLKLFMSFPAGKLEATMIDPLELGASFQDIPKLAEGPNAAHIIDTKIWSKEKDIENALATLRQKLENITQAYGDDHRSRLKKEAIRALAITDFPVGFTDTALNDLHAIVRNSASLGVCVIICANDTELEKLKQRNGTLVAEIAQSVVETKAVGKKLMFASDNQERMYLRIDEMTEVLKHKKEILAQISSVIEHMPTTIESFANMFKEDIYDSNNWFTGSHKEIAVPIGIKGANTVVKMVLGKGGGNVEHHVLISGVSGAGKSTLLHTLIMSTLISYSPDEVQMYLLDFKEGVEFSDYTHYRLPSLRVVAINSEREFGLRVLKELCEELEQRTKYFTKYGASGINEYLEMPGVKKVPKLLLIFDEVQELFRNSSESDTISRQCLSCINKLVMQGRAMGIHIILACQDFRNCSGLETYFSQMAVRIAVRGTENGATSILEPNNAGIKTLQNQPAGSAIYNSSCGVESANNFFRISYIKKEERKALLERMNAYYMSPGVSDLFEGQQARILLTNAEDDVHNCFNKLIFEGPDSITQLGKSKDGYGLLIGQGFGKKSSIFVPEIRCKDRDNLLVVTKDENTALSIFELSAMSILYEKLHANADVSRRLIYVVDLSASELTDEECDFDFFKSQFPQQVEIAKIGEVEDLIAALYEEVIGRSEGTRASDERIFLLFFGISRAKRLTTGSIYDEDGNGELSAGEMLQKIILNGPKYGINSIVWGENLKRIELVLGDRYSSMFNKRIAFNLDEESMESLVAESESKAIQGKTAVYMDISKDVTNTHFRPYDVPAKEWIEDYAEAYENVIKEGGY